MGEDALPPAELGVDLQESAASGLLLVVGATWAGSQCRHRELVSLSRGFDLETDIDCINLCVSPTAFPVI